MGCRVVRLENPVQAEVIESFGDFEKGQVVTINRATDQDLLGVEGRWQGGNGKFIPKAHIDGVALMAILRQL